jgi:predicted dehydrogenase
LKADESKLLAEMAQKKGCVNQVGYHNRFIGTFIEAKRLLKAGALGEIYHISGSAFGPVVIRPKSGGTWRSKKAEGGGCLHDYSSHVVDLMAFLVGPPKDVLGARLQSIFSKDVEDAVYATFSYGNNLSGQLETNWSDDSHRKMSTTVTIYGTNGKLTADRQEIKVYLRDAANVPGYAEGWTTRYITELQKPVSFYLRGEEYSAQIDAFVDAIKNPKLPHENSFASAYETDRTIEMILKTHARSQ